VLAGSLCTDTGLDLWRRNAKSSSGLFPNSLRGPSRLLRALRDLCRAVIDHEDGEDHEEFLPEKARISDLGALIAFPDGQFEQILLKTLDD